MKTCKGQTVITIILYLLTIIVNTVELYEIPKPKIEAYSPRGLKISIPDVPGMSFMAFHGELNEELRATQPGNINGEIREPVNGFWVYENPQTVVQPQDVLHYWIFVQFERLGYRLDDQRSVIRELIDKNKKPTRPTRPTVVVTPRLPIQTDRPTRPTQPPIQPPIQPPTQPTTQPPTQPSTQSPTTCLPTITVVRGLDSVCKGQLIFEENFDTMDTRKWKKDIKIPLDTEDAEFVSYQNFAQNCYVNDSKLFIVPKLLKDFPGFTEESIKKGELNLGSACTGTFKRDYECTRRSNTQFILPPVVSCKLTTKSSFNFIYGKIEIRAKFPKGDWIIPQLYLEPSESYYGFNDFASGQLRVGLARGNEALTSRQNTVIDGSLLSGGMVISRNSTLRDVWMKATLLDRPYSEEFHTYTLTWSNQQISVAVDGGVYAIYKPNFRTQALAYNIPYAPAWNTNGFMAPFDREFYLSLAVAVGGMGDFPDFSRNGPYPGVLKPWNNTHPKSELYFWMNKNNWLPTWRDLDPAMQIDYVKVWAL